LSTSLSYILFTGDLPGVYPPGFGGMTLNTTGLIPRVGRRMALPAFNTTPGVFPGFSCIGGFEIMTYLAIQVSMFAGEGKSGPGMIKTPVAVHAGGSDGSIFDGFFDIPCPGEADDGVTFPAFHRFMKSQQGKPRLVVIKHGSGFKGIEPVTFLAIA